MILFTYVFYFLHRLHRVILRLWSNSSEDGELRPIYEGLYKIGGYDEEYFSPYMGTRIIYGLVHLLLLRRSTIALYDMYFAFLVFSNSWTVVCILVIQRPGVLLKLFE
jgi:hypothetical protein